MSTLKKEAMLGIFLPRAGGKEQYSKHMFHSSSIQTCTSTWIFKC